MMNTELAVKQLAALAQSSRLAIYRALVVAGETGNTPNELIALLGLANATLSFHLKTPGLSSQRWPQAREWFIR